ncbi:polyadenylate-binding protein-interacting protein 1-like isoform X3 [Aquila chrysaetos chrysaetos]|uniref:polyadenylate-binding protein-interacting protein 1-like isoform X3 n=1 Tax=Aquila chrysaetos chrysaetos TaxID=223781 RepID=UPI001B7D332B|nr:polyadenylate-binding protein-interacting protein 1-like isoform X3 [Aquila chrysaetos chrysaetos]
MSDSFDRAPGAGRGQGRGGAAPLSGADLSESSGGACFGGSDSYSLGSAEQQQKTGGLFPQQEPLRPPKTAPLGTGNAEHLQQARIPSGSQDKVSVPDSGPEMAGSQVAVAPVVKSKLSVKAPEFYPSGYNQNFNQNFTATSVPNFSYMGARLCNYLSHHLTISPQSGNFRQLLLQRCRTEYENRDEAAKGDETTRKQFHAFVLFLAELYLNLEIKGTKGQVTRAEILQEGLRQLLNVLFSNPVDNNLMCAVKLLKLTGSVLEDAWKEKGKNDMEEMIQRIENVVLDANCSRDVKHMLLKLVELRSSNWGRVHGTSPHTEATPENDPNYFMNEPTFYTSDGVPFTAADPDYQEKYQELLEREDLFPDYEENGTDLSGPGDQYFHDLDDKMDPEIEEAYEKFCLESEHKRKQ